MASNFLQWNPAQNNQKTDNQYSIDTMRTGGAVTGVFAKELANKLFYQVTTMVSAIGTMMSNKGYTISDSDLAILITAMSNILTKADFGSVAGTVCQGNDPRLNSPGVKVWFWQNLAPSGWTIDATAVDAVLAVKGGANAFNVNGGIQSGTWTHPNHIHNNGAAHSHANGAAHYHNNGAAHSHSISGSHTHWNYSDSMQYQMTTGASAPGTTADTYGGGNTSTYAGGTTDTYAGGNTGGSATANTWRPLAQVGIICTKN